MNIFNNREQHHFSPSSLYRRGQHQHLVPSFFHRGQHQHLQSHFRIEDYPIDKLVKNSRHLFEEQSEAMIFKPLFAVLLVAAVFQVGHSKEQDKKPDELNDDFLESEEIDIDFNDNGSGEADIEESLVNDIEPDKGCQAVTRRNTDEYIDKVLAEVRPKLPEPAFLPERLGRRLRLFNGTLFNLDTVRRTGAAMARCTDTSFSFLVPVSFQNLTGHYNWEVDSRVSVFRGFIKMFVGSVDADVLYTRQRGNGETPTQKALVEKLTIHKLEGVKVEFDGLGPLNRIASRVTGLVTRFFNRGVSRALEGPVKSAINKELRNVEKYEMYYF
ncbi:hypothetical protein JTE90_006474 [Oedothorax gibbosus]|uniref:Uncharacterized protein n=1 Tax=Oedothorax gibbosus TaxID=931172 RepID=A0AAV6UGK5_9ARAC|nr:hypothetical protein JTE90_006474 [Oedothorax gibbosus]